MKFMHKPKKVISSLLAAFMVLSISLQPVSKQYVNKSSPIFLLVVGARMIYHKGRKSL